METTVCNVYSLRHYEGEVEKVENSTTLLSKIEIKISNSSKGIKLKANESESLQKLHSIPPVSEQLLLTSTP